MHSFTQLLLLCSAVYNGVEAMGKFADKSRNHQARHERQIQRDASENSLAERAEKFRYLSNATKPFLVESMPNVTFDIGEMYSGLIPIDYSNTSEALFFVFHPTTGAPVDEITIWLNGGPGCSSLEGFFQENGPYVWQPGTYAPVQNPYSWVNLTNMIWVEQPIGTGFSIGTPKATTQEETAADFVKFFKNFEDLFGIKNYKVYVTGESYAGRYVPYISAAMLDQNDTTYYNLSGALVYDPCIGEFDGIQEEYPAVPYVNANANLFNFNASFMAELEALHQSCGYADYIEKYLVFPPAGVQPPSYFNYTSQADCDVFDLINNAALEVNVCFDIYEINTQCPLLWDVLGFPGDLEFLPPGAQNYFNRTDVKTAFHAPQYVDWSECSTEYVFVGGDAGPEGEGDTSKDPIQGVLPQVIEATNRVLVSNGDFDMIILTNGTLMSIQNMTCNQEWDAWLPSAPSAPINITMPDLQYTAAFEDNGYGGVDGPQGIMGVQHYERGLMWAETYQSGHMQPMYQPRVTYRHMQWLLGHVDTL